MRQIHVLLPGLLTTVQDLGREGFGPMGVSPSGAADPISLRLGNRLLGNADASAALEMTLLGGTFLFPQGAVVALTGSDFGATLDGLPVELMTSVKISPGQILRLRHTRSGARCYLCVQGGIAVEPFLGSASTHILSGLGGFEGRALRKGDVLKSGPTVGSFRKRKLGEQAREGLAPRQILRVTPGPQAHWFPESSRQLFYRSMYCVTEESNRLGLRLVGPRLETASIPAGFPGEMVTEGVSLGAIQVPYGGLPIILFIEQQTTGGYPKIANVISADLPSLGQLRPRDEIRFQLVGWDVARHLLREQKALLASKELMVE